MGETEIQERVYQFSLRVVRLCRALDGDRMGRLLLRQLLRAGTAVGANLEEAQGAQSQPHFIAKVSVARKEAFETHHWLRLIRDSGVVPPAKMDDIIQESDEIARILSAIVLSAKRQE